MGAPKHLWSDQWQADSAARAEELARRRGQQQPPVEPEPDLEALPHGPSLAQRIRARLSAIAAAVRGAAARLRAPRTALVALGVVLLSAGAAFAVVSSIANSGSGQAQTMTQPRAWLGLRTENAPYTAGVAVASVAPGSPAASAGLQPGDVVTQIGNQPILTVNDVNTALDGMSPGERVPIQFNRGLAGFTTMVTLTSRPASSP